MSSYIPAPGPSAAVVTAEITAAVAAEAAARDAAIATAVSDEADARDAAIAIAIAQEASDRDDAIDAAIATEVTNRNSAITTAVAAEATARDAAIAAAIATEVTNRNAAIAAATPWRLAGTTAATGTVSTGSWDFTSNVANVDFTGLGAFTEVMVIVRNMTLSVAGGRNVRVSSDGGATFLSASGDYITIQSTGAEVNQTGISTETDVVTAARSGECVIHGFNQTGWKFAMNENRDVSASILITNANAMNAIRIYPGAGGNITGGSIRVFAR